MNEIDQYIHDFVRSEKFKKELQKAWSDVEFPVSLTYALERLVILHVKLWNLENQAREWKDEDPQLAFIKRSIDHLNGVQRPKLVKAIGQMMAKAIQLQDSSVIQESSTKQYGAATNSQQEAIVRLRNLANKLERIKKDPQYRAIWPLLHVRGTPYTGLTWTKELKEAKQFLEDLDRA